MKKFTVHGSIEYNFSVEVEADSEDEAEKKAIDYVGDGRVDLGMPVSEPEIHTVELMPKVKGKKKV